MRIAVEVRGGVARTRDLSTGRVVAGPFEFAATRFVAEESSAPGPGDGKFVYEGEWSVAPRPENQAS